MPHQACRKLKAGPKRQISSLGVGFEQGQQSYFFARLGQALSHLERDQAAERVTNQQVRAARLHGFNRIEKELSHVFDGVQRRIHAIRAFRLHPIDWMIRLDTLYELKKVHHAAADAMRDKNWRRGISCF